MLVLSLALSPVSAYADELDTPVHEEPIDELQSGSDWVTGHYSLTKYGKTVVLDVYSFCSFEWTEGISGRFTSVSLSLLNITVNGYSASPDQYTEIVVYSYNLGKAAKRRFIVSSLLGGYAYIEARVYVDEYGVLSTYAEIVSSLNFNTP